MRIERRYTKDGQSAYAGIEFRLTTSEIRNPDGSVVFKLDNVEVPEFWSQVASDVLAQKYFRKAGVPARLKKVVVQPRTRSAVISGRALIRATRRNVGFTIRLSRTSQPRKLSRTTRFSIKLSNGYSRAGRVVRGTVIVTS